jgi:AraC family transcriptional regulator
MKERSAAARRSGKQGETTMSTSFPVEVTELPALRLAGVPHHGPYPGIGAAFGKLEALIAERGLRPQIRGIYGVYHDDPGAVPEADLRSHAAADLGGAVPEGFVAVDVPAGRHAVLHHRGPYSGLAAAWGELYAAWLPQSDEVPRTAPAREFYVNGPDKVAEEALLTDICVPVE